MCVTGLMLLKTLLPYVPEKTYPFASIKIAGTVLLVNPPFNCAQLFPLSLHQDSYTI